MKIEKMKENKAGSYMQPEFAAEIIDELIGHDADDSFIDGAACILGYLTQPKDGSDYGKPFARFYEDGMRNRASEPPAEVVAAAHKVIEQLKDMGVDVVSAYIVEGGR